jgi:hypothetical protein
MPNRLTVLVASVLAFALGLVAGQALRWDIKSPRRPNPSPTREWELLDSRFPVYAAREDPDNPSNRGLFLFNRVPPTWEISELRSLKDKPSDWGQGVCFVRRIGDGYELKDVESRRVGDLILYGDLNFADEIIRALP